MNNMFLIGGDWRYFWPENIGNFAHLPSAWDSILNTGVGEAATGTLWITSYLNLTAFFSKLGISWDLTGLIFWIVPSVIFSFLGANYLFKIIFPLKPKLGILSGFIYLFNTYFLMIISGGQMGVALSFSLAPLVLARFICNAKAPSFKNSLIFGLLLSAQLLFDPRLTYITLLALFIFCVFNISRSALFGKNILMTALIPSTVLFLLHSYWIIPLFITKTFVSFGGAMGGADFLSFAKFENTISLLHPNWPENIFGKVYFMKPEFLMIPIIAYSSLFFINKRDDKTKTSIIFLSFLGLFGSFLAKGNQEPLGGIYLYLFNHFPGFFLFRDPTKWYLLVALSYSVLVPFAIYELSQAVGKYSVTYLNKNVLQKTIVGIFIFFFIFTLRDISNIYWRIKPKVIDKEYSMLRDLLVKDQSFSRTFWVPQWQRFGYFSNTHPAVGRGELLNTLDANLITKMLDQPQTEKLLKLMSVKYIIVPYDSEGEIFLKDRKYNKKSYENTITNLDKISWLKKMKGFNKLAVYEIPTFYNHFWILSDGRFVNNLHDQQTSEAHYTVAASNVKKGDILVFSENFNNGWYAKIGKNILQSSPYEKTLNSFVMPENGSYKIEIYYHPQKLVNMGLVISTSTLLGMIFILLYFSRRKI